MKGAPLGVAGLVALAVLGTFAAAETARADSELCVECLQVRVGPPVVVRGPFPDELDATFSALKLPDGTFRGFSANGSTYAIDGPTLWDMDGQRQEVLQAGAPGSINDCGRWLTSLMRSGDKVLGLVHQERDCDYDQGRDRQVDGDRDLVAMTASPGPTWEPSSPERDSPQPDRDRPARATARWSTAATAISTPIACGIPTGRRSWRGRRLSDPTDWHKYYEGAWNEPGLGGKATAIGFLGPGAGYLMEPGWSPPSRPIRGSADCGCRCRKTRCRSSTSTNRFSRSTAPIGTGRRTPISSPMGRSSIPTTGATPSIRVPAELHLCPTRQGVRKPLSRPSRGVAVGGG